MSGTAEGGAAGIDGSATDGGLDGLFRREAPRLTRFFRKRTGDGEGALDLVQEVFLRMLGAAPSQALRNPEAYLQRIARNLLFDRAKRVDTRMAVLHLPFDDATDVAVPADQETMIEARDRLDLYARAVDELATKTRNVYLLHRVEGLTYRQISARIGIGMSTVEYHIARALVHIDRVLGEG